MESAFHEQDQHYLHHLSTQTTKKGCEIKNVATKDEKVFFPQPESAMFELFRFRNFCILIHPLIHMTSIIHFYSFSTLKILTSKFWMFIIVNACDDNGQNIQRKI